MLNIGFSELLLTAAIAMVAIGPKEMPGALRQAMRGLRQLREFGDGLKRQFHQMVDEAGLNELNTTTIIDLEGRKQQAYDISDLHILSQKTAIAPDHVEGGMATPEIKPGEGA